MNFGRDRRLGRLQLQPRPDVQHPARRHLRVALQRRPDRRTTASSTIRTSTSSMPTATRSVSGRRALTATPVYQQVKDVDTVDIKYARVSALCPPSDNFRRSCRTSGRKTTSAAAAQVTPATTWSPAASTASTSSARSRRSRRTATVELAALEMEVEPRLRDADLEHLVLRPQRPRHQRQLRRLRAQRLVRLLWQFAAADGAGGALLRRLGLVRGSCAWYRRASSSSTGRPASSTRTRTTTSARTATWSATSRTSNAIDWYGLRALHVEPGLPVPAQPEVQRGRALRRGDHQFHRRPAPDARRPLLRQLRRRRMRWSTSRSGWERPTRRRRAVPRRASATTSFLFKANFAWDVTDHSMLYATFSQGYRHARRQCGPDHRQVRRESGLPDVQVGHGRQLRTRLQGRDGLAELLACRSTTTDWKNPQLNTATSNWGFFAAMNGESATTQGIELELSGAITDS